MSHVIEREGAEEMANLESKPQTDIDRGADADPLASVWARYLASVAMTVAATIVAIAVDSKLNIPNLSLVFVIPVIVAGLGFGLGPSLCAAILGALAFNFFLTAPRYTLVIDDPSNIWAMALLFVVGLVVSGVAFASHRRAAEASLLRKQAAILQGYSRDVAAAGNVDAIASITSRALAALFGVSAVVMLAVEGRIVSVKRTRDADPREAELEAAQSCLTTGAVLRGGVYPYPDSRFDFWPARTADGQGAVIGLAFDPDERPATPDAPVTVVANILALALDRQNRREAAN
jgi:K+-sensing histidine kinase KdpD